MMAVARQAASHVLGRARVLGARGGFTPVGPGLLVDEELLVADREFHSETKSATSAVHLACTTA